MQTRGLKSPCTTPGRDQHHGSPRPLAPAPGVVAALLAAAEEAELLVLGSRGLSGVTGFVVGSVSQRVVARSPRPVVLVRAGETSAGAHLPASDGVSPEEIPRPRTATSSSGWTPGVPATN
ncbi:universal stress protein [Streptomyces sp. NPDC002845]